MAVAAAAATAKVVVALVVAAAGGPGVRRKAEFMTQKLRSRNDCRMRHGAANLRVLISRLVSLFSKLILASLGHRAESATSQGVCEIDH